MPDFINSINYFYYDNTYTALRIISTDKSGGNVMNRVLPMVKKFRELKMYNRMKIAVMILLTLTIFFSIFLSGYSENVTEGLAENLIRLHVVANSDSPEDQALKRDVRDAVLEYMKKRLRDSRDIEQTRHIINTEMEEIKRIAAETVRNKGRDYKVDAALGKFPFPTKMYGDIVLPAGVYEALKITIGEGAGENWWCVLFPPLCFVDVSHGTVPESAKQGLKEVLTSEEYRLITSAEDSEDIPIRVRFKILDFLQKSRVRFTGMISRIFG